MPSKGYRSKLERMRVIRNRWIKKEQIQESVTCNGSTIFVGGGVFALFEVFEGGFLRLKIIHLLVRLYFGKTPLLLTHQYIKTHT